MTLAPVGQRPRVQAGMLPPGNNDNNDFIELEAKMSSCHSGVLMHLSQQAKNRGTVLAAGWCTWCQGCSSSTARKSMPRCSSSLRAVLATTYSWVKDHWKIGLQSRWCEQWPRPFRNSTAERAQEWKNWESSLLIPRIGSYLNKSIISWKYQKSKLHLSQWSLSLVCIRSSIQYSYQNK